MSLLNLNYEYTPGRVLREGSNTYSFSYTLFFSVKLFEKTEFNIDISYEKKEDSFIYLELFGPNLPVYSVVWNHWDKLVAYDYNDEEIDSLNLSYTPEESGIYTLAFFFYDYTWQYNRISSFTVNSWTGGSQAVGVETDIPYWAGAGRGGYPNYPFETVFNKRNSEVFSLEKGTDTLGLFMDERGYLYSVGENRGYPSWYSGVPIRCHDAEGTCVWCHEPSSSSDFNYGYGYDVTGDLENVYVATYDGLIAYDKKYGDLLYHVARNPEKAWDYYSVSTNNDMDTIYAGGWHVPQWPAPTTGSVKVISKEGYLIDEKELGTPINSLRMIGNDEFIISSTNEAIIYDKDMNKVDEYPHGNDVMHSVVDSDVVYLVGYLIESSTPGLWVGDTLKAIDRYSKELIWKNVLFPERYSVEVGEEFIYVANHTNYQDNPGLQVFDKDGILAYEKITPFPQFAVTVRRKATPIVVFFLDGIDVV